MPLNSGAVAFKLAFEISPITLTGGVAGGIPGGMIPLLALSQAGSFSGLLSASPDFQLDHAFANFYPLPGSTLISNQIGNYPFANMEIAANCIIAQPTVLSMLMRINVREPGGYATKLNVMTALRSTLKNHCRAAGTFIVATTVGYDTNLILLDLVDVSGGESLQAQVTYRWDFIRPLVTLEDAAAAQNAMMSRLSSGVQTDGALSGIGPTLGSTGTLATPAIAPSATASASAGVTGLPGTQSGPAVRPS